MRRSVALWSGCAVLVGLGACELGDGGEPGDGVANESAGTEEGEGEGETGEPDSDGDGLGDAEEEALGTDPTLVDTDGDGYWDSWELIEGTDPLDYDNRIYTGFWPYNPAKDELEQGTWELASRMPGSAFPRESWLDQFGEDVDIYDFTAFTDNPTGEPAYFIVDLSAQWCNPCHNVADWISGVDSPNTEWIEELYPTVRDKVHDGRIFWMTFVVEDAVGNAPTLADGQSWAMTHADPRIPVFTDAAQKVYSRYGSGAFPHFFLLDYEAKMELWIGGSEDPDNPYPIIGIVDEYL